MDSYIINGVCRCCASQGSSKDIDSAYTWMGDEEIYSKMLRDCFDIALERSEAGHDGGICELCVTQLRNAFNFKKQVVNTEEMLKKRIHSDPFKTDVKLEVSREDPSDSDNDAADHDMGDDSSVKDFLVPIKMEVEVDAVTPTKAKRAAKAGTSSAKKPKLEAETSKKSKKVTTKTISEGTSLKKKIIIINSRTDREKIIVSRMVELKKHLKNIQTILLCSNATPIRCKGSIGYGCGFCKDEFPEPQDLKKHTIATHDDKDKLKFMQGAIMQKFLVKLDITGLKCNICKDEMEDVDCLREHLKDVHKKHFYDGLKNHIVPFTFDGQDAIACVVCRRRFNNYKVLLEHMNGHYRNYICESCGAGFVNRAILYAHSRRHVVGSEKCQFCDKVFKNKTQKQSHERAIHVHFNMRSICGYCGERFSDYAKKNHHVVKEHGGKAVVLKCQACDKVFQNQRALTMHTKSYHLMLRKTTGKKKSAKCKN